MDDETRKRINENLRPFKSYDSLTDEEIERQRSLCSKGGKARQEQIQKRKSMEEVTKDLLYTKLSRDEAKKVLGDDEKLLSDENLSVMAVTIARMLQECLQGNTRAFEAVRDTGGFSPKKEIDLTADVMTDADRALIANIQKRIG